MDIDISIDLNIFCPSSTYVVWNTLKRMRTISRATYFVKASKQRNSDEEQEMESW